MAQGYVGVRVRTGRCVGANHQTRTRPAGSASARGIQSELRGELRGTARPGAEAQPASRPPAYPQVGTRLVADPGGDGQRGVQVLVTSSDGDVGELTRRSLQEFLRPRAHGEARRLRALGVDDARASLASGDADLVASDEIRTGPAGPAPRWSGTTWFVTQGPRTSGQLGSHVGPSWRPRSRPAAAPAGPSRRRRPAGQSCYETTYREGSALGDGEYVPLDPMAPYLGLG